MTLRPALLALLLVAGPTPGGAGESVLTVDAAASRVSFTLDATLHEVHGTFAVTAGEVRFDAERGIASGRITVDARSGDTGNAKRDRKMHAEVLRSAEHPEIVFVATGLAGALDFSQPSKLELRGTLRLLGVDHAVEIPVEVTAAEGVVRAHTELDVPYVAWGLEDPSVFVLRVGKSVAVAVDLAGRLTGGGEPAPAD